MEVGIDTIDIVRMQKFVDNEKFLTTYFTEYEIKYFNSTVNRTARLAGLFSAKEAFVKALGIGMGAKIPFNEIEINHDSNGKPFIKLTERAHKVVQMLGFSEYKINISHSHTSSVAVCIIN